jgi:ribosomal protein S19E (S16A)
MAAIARKIYLNKNSGVGQLAKVKHYSAACQRVFAFERHFRTLAESPSSGIRQQRAQGRQGDFSTSLLETLSGIVSTQHSNPSFSPTASSALPAPPSARSAVHPPHAFVAALP